MGIDPSISCTGYAVLDSEANSDGRFIAAGYIVPTKKGSLVARILDLAAAVEKRIAEQAPDVIVIETPAETGRAMSGQRFSGTAMTIPVYGAAVGACIIAARKSGAVIVGTPSDEWTKRRDTPRCSGDPNKENRVEYVRKVWNILDLGPKTLAGNVADALLIARWMIGRLDAADYLRELEGEKA